MNDCKVSLTTTKRLLKETAKYDEKVDQFLKAKENSMGFSRERFD